jgi:ATP-dependent Clp protease ATP-binding subunit ClpC
MNDEIRSLIDSLRLGLNDDPTDKITLLTAALRAADGAEVELLLSLLCAPQAPLRMAAVDACRGREEAALHEALAALVEDPDTRVRLALVAVLADGSAAATAECFLSLLRDEEADVRLMTVKASKGWASCCERHRELLATDERWEVRQAAAEALDPQMRPDVVGDLMSALAHDDDCDVRQECAKALEKCLGRAFDHIAPHLPTDVPLLFAVEQALHGQNARRTPALLAWIADRIAGAVDPTTLATFGTDLTALAHAGTLPHAYGMAERCRTLVDQIRQDPRRSLVLLGASGVGKSALVNELVYELAKPEHGGWHVLRVTPADFMTDTKYAGEWETKVKNLVDAIRHPRRVLLYVPSLGDLSSMGRWSKSDFNVAAALAPHLEDGTIQLLGENTVEEYERGLGHDPSLRRLFERVLVPEATPEETRTILACLRDEAIIPIPDPVLEHLQEISGHFLGQTARPGNAVSLLRAVLEAVKADEAPLTARDVLNALSRSTGIPAHLLDDAVPLNLPDIRAFFEGRIIGQPEGLEAVIDLITLIKAGLTDPHKPMGIFLFVGPTGVGKTELARALAEFIFGDAARLLRYDMSEYANPESFERLLGAGERPGTLTDAVRQHPFSVVLLDEIEKAHLNVFDLCLQLFDAGRLTDGRGRTVDFRRTIVILTSNIGATTPTPALGFTTEAAPAPTGSSQERTFRELAHVFRPELLNRLDRIINFRPLTLEVAERIARRELDLVLQRSGITRRQLAVDVDPAVVSLLVKEGYSPHFGARPLKRTVERMALLPLARVIAGGTLTERTLLRLQVRSDRIEVQVTQAKPMPATAASPAMADASLQQAAAALLEQWETVETLVPPFAARKSELLARSHEAAFYQDPEACTAAFDEIHRLEQFLSRVSDVHAVAEKVHYRITRQPCPAGDEAALRERLAGVAAQVQQLHFVATCQAPAELCDALLCVTRVDGQGDELSGVELLMRMYLGVGHRWRMEAEVLAECYDEKSDTAYLQLCGLGAYALLKQEAGLHQLDRHTRARNPRSGREQARLDRERVRVEVLPLGAEPEKRFLTGLQTRVHTLKPPRTRLLAKADLWLALFHEPSLRSLEAWTRGPRAEAEARLQRILFAQVQRMAAPAEEVGIIRHYDLGPAPRIRDHRTGRATTRIKPVLDGALELFWLPEE